MDENSTQMIKRYFREYYFRFGTRIKAPSEIESREFGYLPFEGTMIRHLSFNDIGAFRATLVKEVPAGVYCSNSFYTDPRAEMHLKGWKRAELIFDIDAGSLKQPCRKIHDIWLCKGCGRKEFGLRPEICPSCKSNRLLELPWACPICIEAAKKETFRLTDFLEFDLGIAPSEIRIYFSGNAGYHVTVQNSVYETLDTHARAEIADYLSARGLDYNLFVSPKILPSDPGWRGRVARFVRDLPEDDALFSKVGPLHERHLFKLANNASKKQLENFMNRVIAETSVRIDAMVTTDVHRIFRMPETLNNKTGLIKRECSNNLAQFDPLVEAIALKEEEDQAVPVVIDMCPKIELGGRTYGPFSSETRELPPHVAVYVVAKGAGRFAASSSSSSSLSATASPL